MNGEVWFAAVLCKGAADYQTFSVTAAAGYAQNFGGRVVRVTVDAHGHRITDAPLDPHDAVAEWSARVDA